MIKTLLLGSAFALTAASASAEVICNQGNGLTNVRTSVEAGGTIRDRLKNGTRVTIKKRVNNADGIRYFQVTYSDGTADGLKEGFVYSGAVARTCASAGQAGNTSGGTIERVSPDAAYTAKGPTLKSGSYAPIAFSRAVSNDEQIYSLCPVRRGPCGYVDVAGKWLVKPTLTFASRFVDGVAYVKQGRYYGYINRKGEWIVEPRLTSASVFHKGHAYVRFGRKYGMINTKGEWVVTPNFDSLYRFNDGLAAAKVGRLFGYIDQQGQWVIQPQFKTAYSFRNGLAVVRSDRLYGYIDKTGAFAIQPRFKTAFDFKEGLARVRESRNYGFIDRTGNWVIQPLYSIASDFAEGMARAKRGSRYGFLGRDGQWVIQPQFRYVTSFREGLAAARISTLNGYIDKTGKFVIPEQFKSAGSFYEGTAMARTDKRAGRIDKKGNWIVDAKYDTTIAAKDLIQVRFGNREGYVDKKGKPLTFTSDDYFLGLLDGEIKKLESRIRSQNTQLQRLRKKVTQLERGKNVKSPLCKHVYLNKQFRATGFPLRAGQSYVVAGFPRKSGYATVRDKVSGVTQDVRCSAIPRF